MTIDEELIAYNEQHKFKDSVRYVKEGCFAIIKLLLNNGLDVNYRDSKDLPLGYYALKYNHREIFDLLIRYGMNLNQPILLVQACDKQLYSIAELLVKVVDVNSECYYPYHGGMARMRPLFMAIKRNNIDIVGLLLANGADPKLLKDYFYLYKNVMGESCDPEILELIKNYHIPDIKEPQQ